MTKTQTTKSEPVSGEEVAVRQVVDEIKVHLARGEQEQARVRYLLGARVNVLESSYGDRAVDKLAAALGRGYSADNLRIFARIARTWSEVEFADRLANGLTISDFRELAKVADATVRALIEQEAIEKSWSSKKLKTEVRKVVCADNTPRPEDDASPHEPAVGATKVINAINKIITAALARRDEHARLNAQLEDLGQLSPEDAQALAPEINKALDAVRAQRRVFDETERHLVAALSLPAGLAADPGDVSRVRHEQRADWQRCDEIALLGGSISRR